MSKQEEIKDYVMSLGYVWLLLRESEEIPSIEYVAPKSGLPETGKLKYSFSISIIK